MQLDTRDTRGEIIVRFFVLCAHIAFAAAGLLGGAVLLGALTKLVWRAFQFGWQLWT